MQSLRLGKLGETLVFFRGGIRKFARPVTIDSLFGQSSVIQIIMVYPLYSLLGGTCGIRFLSAWRSNGFVCDVCHAETFTGAVGDMEVAGGHLLSCIVHRIGGVGAIFDANDSDLSPVLAPFNIPPYLPLHSILQKP